MFQCMSEATLVPSRAEGATLERPISSFSFPSGFGSLWTDPVSFQPEEVSLRHRQPGRIKLPCELRPPHVKMRRIRTEVVGVGLDESPRRIRGEVGADLQGINEVGSQLGRSPQHHRVLAHRRQTQTATGGVRIPKAGRDVARPVHRTVGRLLERGQLDKPAASHDGLEVRHAVEIRPALDVAAVRVNPGQVNPAGGVRKLKRSRLLHDTPVAVASPTVSLAWKIVSLPRGRASVWSGTP